MPPKKSAHQRGLGLAHRKRRTYLLSVHVDGTPCWWCGLPMYVDPSLNWDYAPYIATDPNAGKLHADHNRARSVGGGQADRLLHNICNKRRGDGARDHLRPALSGMPLDATANTDAEHAEALGSRVMAWP